MAIVTRGRTTKKIVTNAVDSLRSSTINLRLACYYVVAR